MSTLSGKEEKVASILAMPVLTAATSIRMVKAATSQLEERAKARAETQSPPTTDEGMPKVVFRIADRLRSHFFGDDKVSFYQYFREDVIIAVSRRNGHQKEKVFTREIAYSIDVAFDLDGAIAWIRQTGFKDADIARAMEVPPWEPYPEERIKKANNAKVDATPTVPAVDKEAGKAETAGHADPESYVTEELPSHRTRPFSGRIVSMGEIEKEGRDDKSFTVYAIRLKAYSGFEKEFLGEHLGELTEELKLKEGDQVTLQLVEKRIFSVKVGRRVEKRSKNIYTIRKH